MGFMDVTNDGRGWRIGTGQPRRLARWPNHARLLDHHSDPAGDGLQQSRSLHPSCAYDDRWACPLSPEENRVTVPIRAGEQAFHQEIGTVSVRRPVASSSG
jgi:hypothetical protein